MRKSYKRRSVLADRIAAGQADPISEDERQIVKDLRAGYEKKYGRANTTVTYRGTAVGSKSRENA